MLDLEVGEIVVDHTTNPTTYLQLQKKVGSRWFFRNLKTQGEVFFPKKELESFHKYGPFEILDVPSLVRYLTTGELPDGD